MCPRLAGIVFAGTAVFSNQAMAANRIFDLYIENSDSKPVTITISSEDNNCYEGTPGVGEVFQNVIPKGRVKITLARVQGHGCNGKQGEFSLVFDPGVGVKTIQHFDFDNDGGLELTPGRVKVYPGTLSPKNPKDGSYTYSTFKTPDVTAGAARGSWIPICQGICNSSHATSISNEFTEETRKSTETVRAITTSLEAGVKFEGAGSVKSKVSTTLETRVGHEMAQSVKRGETNTDTSNYVFTPEQMTSLNIFAIWQWVATTDLSNDQQVVVRSNKFTCTPDGEPPTYYPGSPQDIGACRGKAKAN